MKYVYQAVALFNGRPAGSMGWYRTAEKAREALRTTSGRVVRRRVPEEALAHIDAYPRAPMLSLVLGMGCAGRKLRGE